MRLFKSALLALALAAMTPLAFAADYDIDAAHASAIFSITHLGFSKVQGAIKDLSGTFTYDEAKPEKSAVSVTAKAASIDPFNEARDKHLRSADFFDTDKYPELTFKSTAWKKSGDKAYKVFKD